MPTPPRKKRVVMITGRHTTIADALVQADEEARRMLGATSSGTRSNPAAAGGAPVDPDLVNLASDLAHGILLSSPDDAR